MSDRLCSLSGLVEAVILKRYKRFLADVLFSNGDVATVHCANTGTMRSCWEPGDKVLLQTSDNPKRKLRHTWIACQREGCWVGIDTGVPNKVVAEAARRDCIPGFQGLHGIRTEVMYGREQSRIDVWGLDGDERQVFLEVKNTTLKIEDHVCFPDAVTARGAKHLRELEAMVKDGHRAAIVFFVNRADVHDFDAARDIDPTYALALDQAASAGVEVIPLQSCIVVERESDASWVASWSIRRVLPWNLRVPTANLG